MVFSHRGSPEPVKSLLVARRISQREAADAIGCSHTLLNAVVNARTVPPPRVRDGLRELLDLPVSELFHPETLARLP